MIVIKTIGDERLYGKISKVAKDFHTIARGDLAHQARIYSNELIKGMMHAGKDGQPLRWTSQLLDSAKNILPEEEGFSIILAPYAFPLDRMRTTVVVPARHPSLKRWFMEKRGSVPKFARIHKHPFIRNAYRRARYRLKSELRDLKTLKEVRKI